MKKFKKLLNSIATHEGKIKKGLDWLVSIGNLLWLVIRVLMGSHK